MEQGRNRDLGEVGTSSHRGIVRKMIKFRKDRQKDDVGIGPPTNLPIKKREITNLSLLKTVFLSSISNL